MIDTQPLHEDGKGQQEKRHRGGWQGSRLRQQYAGTLVYTGLDAELKTRGSRGGRARRVSKDRPEYRDKEM